MNQLLPTLGLLIAILAAAIIYKRAFDAQCQRDNRAIRAAMLGIVSAIDADNGKRERPRDSKNKK